MSILPIADQYKYNKRGPLDAKAIVKTHAELLDTATWLVGDTMAAYNGMITAVWLNKDDPTKNGVYFLHDPAITSAVKAPDVTNEANWHKLGGVESTAGVLTQLELLTTRLDTHDTAIENKADKSSVYTKDEIAAIIGTPVEGKSIIQLIEDTQTAIASNTEAINAINSTAIPAAINAAKAYADTKFAEIPFATALTAGVVKASSEVTVAEDGTMNIGFISTDKLVQGADTLVLSAGDSDDT